MQAGTGNVILTSDIDYLKGARDNLIVYYHSARSVMDVPSQLNKTYNADPNNFILGFYKTETGYGYVGIYCHDANYLNDLYAVTDEVLAGIGGTLMFVQ